MPSIIPFHGVGWQPVILVLVLVFVLVLELESYWKGIGERLVMWLGGTHLVVSISKSIDI